MAKSKEQKKEIIENIKNKIDQAKSIVFVTFDTLGVKDNEELRKKLREENSEYYAAKKTLFDLAFSRKKINDLDIKKFPGQVAAAFSYGDEVAPARVIDKFMGNYKNKISFLGGILENKFLGADEIKALAGLPSKKELYAKIVGSLNAPISGFVNVLAGNLKNLVYVLKAIEEKK